MRAIPVVLAILVLAPTAGAIVLPNVVISLDLQLPAHARVGQPVTFRIWVGTEQGPVASGLPYQKVDLADNGEIVATGTTDLEGFLRLTKTYHERGVHAISARVDGGNYVQNTFLPAHSGYPPRTLRIGELPSAPSSLVVSGGPHWDEAVLAWAVPADDGGVPLQGYWHELMGATGLVDEATRVVIREGVTPGETYVARVRAENGLGAGPWRTVSFVPPMPPARDALELSITHFTACWHGDCSIVLPGQTITLHTANLDDVRAYAGGRLVDDGAGVPDALVKVETTIFAEHSLFKRIRSLTAPDGSFSAESAIGYHGWWQGECEPISAQATALYPGLPASAAASFTVCFT